MRAERAKQVIHDSKMYVHKNESKWVKMKGWQRSKWVKIKGLQRCKFVS